MMPPKGVFKTTKSGSSSAVQKATGTEIGGLESDDDSYHPLPPILAAKDPEFLARKAKSFVYAVRVLAFRATASNNWLTGSPPRDRRATMLDMGGWVAPPLEERMWWRKESKSERKPQRDGGMATREEERP